MHLISIHASPRQLSKLRNGHNVRIKKGGSVALIVHPNNYDIITRAFRKNKGLEVKLSPEEIAANREMTPEDHAELMEQADINLFDELPMAGRGLFGGEHGTRKMDGGKIKINKKLANTIVGVAKKVGSTLGKPYSKAGINPFDVGYDIGYNYVGPALLGKGIDSRPHPHHVVSGKVGEGISAIDALGRASLGGFQAMKDGARMSRDVIEAQRHQRPIVMGSYSGLHQPASRLVGGRINDHNLIRGRGSSINEGSLPPALQSQPYGANFQFQFFLPPEYQHLHREDAKGSKGNGLHRGSGGLYA